LVRDEEEEVEGLGSLSQEIINLFIIKKFKVQYEIKGKSKEG